MWLVIFGLVCFWSGAAAIIAHLCGWPVIPITAGVGLFTCVVMTVVGSMCLSAGTPLPDDKGMNIQMYFGGTFKTNKYIDRERT